MDCSLTRPRKFRRAGGLLAAAMCQPAWLERADVEDLALRDEDLAGLPDLVPRRVQVDVVDLVEVDLVGLHPPQRRVAGAADVAGGEEVSFGQSLIPP